MPVPTISPILASPVLTGNANDTPTTVYSPNITLIIQAPSSAIFVQAVVSGAQSATFQSTLLLFNLPYQSNINAHYFSLPVSLGALFNTVTLTYYSTYPGDIPANLTANQSPSLVLYFNCDMTTSVVAPPLPPYGFDIAQRSVEVRVTWDQALEHSFVGSNFYMSTTSGGPYFQVNTSLITSMDPESLTPRMLFEIPISAIPFQYVGTSNNTGTTFYSVVTNVVQDTLGNSVLESPYSLEFPVNFFTYPTVYASPLQRSEQDIQVSMLSSINSYNLLHDIKPGSILQDVFINPVASELANLYQRMQFYLYAGYIPTLVTYEDENGDGLPDTLQQSPLRQAIFSAFNLQQMSRPGLTTLLIN